MWGKASEGQEALGRREGQAFIVAEGVDGTALIVGPTMLRKS